MEERVITHYDRTLLHNEMQLETAKRRKDKESEGRACRKLSTCYFDLGQYQKAKNYDEMHLTIAKEIGDKESEGQAYGNLGSCYYSLKDYYEAIRHHEMHLDIAKQTGDEAGERRAYSNLRCCWSVLGEYDKAKYYFEMKQSIARHTGNQAGSISLDSLDKEDDNLHIEVDVLHDEKMYAVSSEPKAGAQKARSESVSSGQDIIGAFILAMKDGNTRTRPPSITLTGQAKEGCTSPPKSPKASSSLDSLDKEEDDLHIEVDVFHDEKMYALSTEPKATATTKAEAQTTPPEILARGQDAINAYKLALEEGKTKNRRLLVTLIGQARTGKTSLLKSLKGEAFDPHEDSTLGIALQPLHLKLQEESWNVIDDSHVVSFEQCVADKMAEYLKSKITEIHSVQSSNDENEKGNPVKQDQLPTKHPKTEGSQHTPFQEPGASPLPEVVFADETKIPEEILELLEDRLKNENKNDEEKHIVLTVLDFAGQQVYYNIHPVFMSSTSIYVLVYNLENDPHARAVSTVGCGGREYPIDEDCPKTNMNHLEFWLSCVASISTDGSGMSEYQIKEEENSVKLNKKLPPVFLVCTHLDQVLEKEKDPESATSTILETLTDDKRPFGEHLVWKIYPVDNTKSGKEKEEDKGIQCLRKDILQAAEKLPQVDEDIPVCWLQFEEEIGFLGENWIDITKAKEIAQKCKVKIQSDGLKTLLNYLHDLKVVIHFEDTLELDNMVIIKPTWLLDMFVKVITVLPIKDWGPSYKTLWQDLEKYGVLHMALVKHVWKDIVSEKQTVTALLSIMEKFSLLCKWQKSDGSEVFLVPSMLKSPAVDEVQELFQRISDGVPTIVMRFTNGHLPLGFFPRFVLFFVEWCTATWKDCKQPKLFRNLAKCDDLGENMEFSVVVVSDMSTITIEVVKDESPTGRAHQQPESLHTFCGTVLKFLKCSLEKMRTAFPWMRHVDAEFCVHCPHCLEKTEACKTHEVKGCKRDECLHYITESDLRSLKPRCDLLSRVEAPPIDKERFSHWFQFCIRKFPKSSLRDLIDDYNMLDDLARCLDREFRVIKNWLHLAKFLGIPTNVLEECSMYREHSPTESLFDFLQAREPDLTMKMLRIALRNIWRYDVCEGEIDNFRDEDKVAAVITSSCDVLDNIALKLDSADCRPVKNWKNLAHELGVSRAQCTRFEMYHSLNPTVELFRYLYATQKDLTMEEITDKFREMKRNDVLQRLEGQPFEGKDLASEVIQLHSDLLLDIAQQLNKDIAGLGGWRKLGRLLEVPAEILDACDPPSGLKIHSPTKRMLEWLAAANPCFTVKDLIIALEKLQRQDAIAIIRAHEHRSGRRGSKSGSNSQGK